MTSAPPIRRHTVASCLALGNFVVVLLAGLLLPLYSDETGWRFQERAAVDGVDIMLNDLCGPNTLARAPWFMMPARYFSALANQALASPLFVRIEGIGCALAWTALLWLLTARLEQDSVARARLRTVLISLMALGILPFLMVLSRPEQPLILMLTLAMLTVLRKPADACSWRQAAARCAVIVIFAVIAMSYHLKGVVYSPVFFACLALCASGRQTLWPRVASGAVLAALTLSSALYWVHRFQCHGDSLVAKGLSEENVAALLSNGGNWLLVASSMAKGLNPLNYFWLIVPADNVNWLPGPVNSSGQTTVFALTVFVLWGSLFACALWSLAQYGWQRRLSALSEPRVVIALALLGCLAAWGASQLNRNHYEASHYMPMTAVFCALSLSLPAGPWVRIHCLGFLEKLAPFAALASVVAVLTAYAGPFRAAAGNQGWIPDLPLSISIHGYPQVRRDIAAAMGRAGMDRGRRYNRLLLDDVTYMDLQANTLPLHWLGVFGQWRGGITDPVAYLRSRNSDGVVMGCRYLPARMREVAGRSGEVCAISRAGLERLAAGGPTPVGQVEPPSR